MLSDADDDPVDMRELHVRCQRFSYAAAPAQTLILSTEWLLCRFVLLGADDDSMSHHDASLVRNIPVQIPSGLALAALSIDMRFEWMHFQQVLFEADNYAMPHYYELASRAVHDWGLIEAVLSGAEGCCSEGVERSRASGESWRGQPLFAALRCGLFIRLSLLCQRKGGQRSKEKSTENCQSV